MGRIIKITDTAGTIVYIKKNERGKAPVIGVVERPLRKIARISSEDEVQLNTEEHREKLLTAKI